MPGAASASAFSICTERVREADPDRYVASLFWPDAARPHVHAVLAFDLEIAKVRDMVSDPMLGEIRLQWWRDAITAEQAAGNPIAEALLDTLARFNLDKGRMLAAIEARSFDLYDDPMPTEAALEGYVGQTSGAVFEAIARILQPGRLPPSAVEAAGRAFGLTSLLRGLPWHVMRGQLFIPMDLLDKFKLPPAEIMAHRNSPALGLVLNDLRARVTRHLAAMREGLSADRIGASACLPAFLCEPYLARMEAPGLNPFETPIEIPRLRRLWTLWRAARVSFSA